MSFELNGWVKCHEVRAITTIMSFALGTGESLFLMFGREVVRQRLILAMIVGWM